MRRRLAVWSAFVVTAALLCAPAIGQARVQTHAVPRAAVKDHCIVKHLPGGGQITICIPT